MQFNGNKEIGHLLATSKVMIFLIMEVMEKIVEIFVQKQVNVLISRGQLLTVVLVG
jgi:hypothetical protein